ncbi:MAG: hypothetical protein KF832_28445 [Caldilineaceae bacterium]|nr:hypothetical protein [Caldilineaceae bacterium]
MGTMLTWLALVMALAAMAYAWKLQQELQIATRRLDRYNRALFDANDEIRKVREEALDGLARLHAETALLVPTRAGFVPGMTVREATALHPQASQILAGFHLGGCNSCAVDADESLADICREHGRDLAQLLVNLNQLLPVAHGTPTSQEGFALPSVVPKVKIPNVEVNF